MENYKLNIGGSYFEIPRESLLKYPNSVLGKLTKTSSHYDKSSNSFFFNRNPDFFNSILDLYRTDVLHLPSNICSAIVRTELQFWEIPLDKLCQCCQHEYFKYEREIEVMETLKKTFENGHMKYKDADLQKSQAKRILNKIWLITDQPRSSMFAQIFSVVFLVVVLMSLVSFMLGSRTEFRDVRDVFKDENVLPYLVHYSEMRFFNEMDLNNSKEVMFVTTIPKPSLQTIDLICVAFFSLEFVLHFISCPRKLHFFKSPLNVIDILLIIDMIALYILDLFIEELVEYYIVTQLYLILRALVVLRLCRLFRFMRTFSGFKILILSLKSSIREFCLLFMSFMVASVIFASLIYYAEFHTPDTFPDIPHSIWWSIVTMTTVGYGDFYPKSGYGYVVGTICAFCGVIILALPIAVVATNFNDFYDKNKEREDRVKLNKKLETKKEKPRSANSIRKVVPLTVEDLCTTYMH